MKTTCANCGQEATCETSGGVRTCQLCLPWAVEIEEQADTIAELRAQLEASNERNLNLIHERDKAKRELAEARAKVENMRKAIIAEHDSPSHSDVTAAIENMTARMRNLPQPFPDSRKAGRLIEKREDNISICPKCGGSGMDSNLQDGGCYVCKGTGEVKGE